MLCGGAAGTVMWAAVLPLDAAKTRMQVAKPGAARDVGLWSQLRIMRQAGNLYPGLAPTLVRAFPANAAQWLAWEAAGWALTALQQEGSANGV